MRTGTDKNLNVEILRIFLTIAVCLHHFRLYSDALPYGGGYIAVDGFFIISGYYLSKHLIVKMADKEEHVFSYIKMRYIRLFPDYFLAFFISFSYRWLIKEIPSTNLWGYVREALMIEFGGVGSGQRINPPDWYCGYLLLAYIVVYIYIKRMKNHQSFLYVTGFMAVCGYIMFAFFSYHINIYPQNQSVLSIAIGRAVAGLLMGCFIYLLDCKTCDIIGKKRCCIRYTVMLFIGIVLIYILFWKNFIPYIDYMAIFLFAILFYLSVSTEGRCRNQKVRCIIEYFGRLCFTIYLNHYLIALIFVRYSLLRMLDWKVVSLCFLSVVFIFSSIVFEIRNFLVLEASEAVQ